MLRTGCVVLFLALGTLPLRCAANDWVGGNDPWDADPFNWSPADEPDPTDSAVFNTNNHVEMAMDNEILSLDLSGSIELDTETYFLDVNGDIALAGSGTILRVGESNLVGLPPTSLSAHNITVDSGSTFANAGFTSFIDPSTVGAFEIGVGGTLAGHNLIRNGDGIASPTAVFVNDGVIRPGSVFDGFILGNVAPTARTLTLAAIDTDARIDLDGVGGNGAVNVTRNQTLDIDIQLEDSFDGVIELAQSATLDIEDAWTFSGTMTVDNGFIAGSPPLIPDVPAGVAYLQGGAITMNNTVGPTVLEVVDSDGTLQIDTTFTANGGTIANNGHIIFNQDATINPSVDFQMIGTEASLTVGPGATVVINDEDMDFDGGGANTNVITVEAGGELHLNLDSFEGNDRADGFLTLNSGELDLTVADGSWTMERRLTLNNTGGGTPALTGSAMVVGDDAIISQSNDADIRVEGSGTSQINVPVTWNSDAELDVAAGATLAVLGFSTFNSVDGAENAQFDGPGDVFFSGGQVNEPTTLNFSGGTVGLDSGGATVILLGAPDFTIDAPLTINAAAIDEYGRSVIIPNPDRSYLTINSVLGADLSVNLDDPNDSWTINDRGVMNVNGGASFTTFLSGADLNMDGEMNVDGLSRTDARLVIGTTGNINFVDGAANLRLRGGDLVSVNRLEGGSINGVGELSAPNEKALHGFGTIDADIDFDGADSELRADDGTLTLGGAILDVGTIGTADSDGVLNVANAWTLAADSVAELLGGELTGATLTNDGLVSGQGLISARVVNNSILRSSGGGTLVVDTAANNNNWHGVSGTGSLRAVGGSTLELHDNANFNYDGEVLANNATVETVGFALHFGSTSTVMLTSGVYRSAEATDFGGAVTVAGGGASTLEVDGARFESTSIITLNGDLMLDGNTQVESGAAFSGGGALVNTAGRTLTLLDGADVDVLVQNDGRLELGSSPGQTSGQDFQQTASGVLEIELQGTGLNQFDRMALTGIAQLGGELEVSLIGGFTPGLGDAFTIFTAASIVSEFDTADFGMAALDPGLGWDLVYNPTNVQLTVVEIPQTILGDYNNDGVVNLADFTVWRNNLGAPESILPPGSTDDNSGFVDEGDYQVWKANFGATNAPLAAISQVPEPAAGALLLLGGLLLGGQRLSKRLGSANHEC